MPFLGYTNSPIAERKLEELLASYGQRRFVDEALRARLQAFSVRAMSQETEELLAELEKADRYRFAISILSLEFDSSLALRLLQNLESQSPIRQAAEIDLYLAWLRRHQTARERFLSDLENWVRDAEHNYGLCWHLARQLRKSGLSKIKTGFNMGWVLRLIGKSLKGLPQLPKIIWSWVMSIPFFLLVLLCELIEKPFPKIGNFGWRFLGKLVSFPFIRPIPWLLSEIWISQGNLFHYVHENYVEAIKSYRSALKLQPNKASLLRVLANSLKLAGELEEAEQVARRALKIAPDNARSWETLMYVLIDAKKAEEAEKLLQQALNRFPNNINLLWSQGVLFHNFHNNYVEAIKSYQAVLKLQPDNDADLLLNLANNIGPTGKLEEAEQVARHALKLAPDNTRGGLFRKVNVGLLYKAPAYIKLKSHSLNPLIF